MRNVILSAALLAATSTGFAGELLVTEGGSAKSGDSGEQYALDVLSDGDVSAMQFALRFPGAMKKLDLSKCLADLPKSHTGMCRAKPETGTVAVVLWSNDNTPLPKGAIPVGRITASLEFAGRGKPGGVEVFGLHMSGKDARPVVSSSTVSGTDAQGRRTGSMIER